jgi:hypothetical protein
MELRRALGLPAGEDDPAFVGGAGEALDAAGLRHWLRVARLVRTSLESNGGLCRSLLASRYGLTEQEEVAA